MKKEEILEELSRDLEAFYDFTDLEMIIIIRIITYIHDETENELLNLENFNHIKRFLNDDLESIEHLFDLKEEEEETIPVSYGLIRNSFGWSRFCDVTNGNHYAAKEFNIEDYETFDVKLSHAKELGLI